MQTFFVFVGLWLIGWRVLLTALLLRPFPTTSSDPDASPRAHPFTLFVTTETAL